MRSPARGSNVSRLGCRCTALGIVALLATVSFMTRPARAQLGLDEAAEDGRVDSDLRLLLRRAAAATSGVPAAPTETTGQETPPVNGRPALATPESIVGLMIGGSPDLAALETRGAMIGTVAGGFITASAPLARIPDLLQVPGVIHLQASSVLMPELDVSVPETDAPALWGSPPPNIPGISGRNVVIGIVDTGVDLTHADFKTSSGATRVKYAWDQTWVGTKPAGFDYGAEYTEAQINAGQASTLQDEDGHGTHIAGAAAGNGRATGSGLAPYRYVGMAPNANLVVVKAYALDNYVVDAVKYVFQKAAALNQAAVVNLSYGSMKGGHDGTSALDVAISALTGPGKIVTAAVGNYGNVPNHARPNILIAGGSTTVSFTIPAYTTTPTSLENLQIEGWHVGNASFDVRLRSPSGYQTATIAPNTSSGGINSADGYIQIDNARVTNARGAKLISIDVWRANSSSPHPLAGTWTITLTRRIGSSAGDADFWITSYVFGTITPPSFTGLNVTFDRTIAAPATADSVISTGAYATKVAWTNANNGTSLWPGLPVLGALADFSARGPRRDGVQRPDFCAPGYGVMSALSTAAQVSDNYKDPDRVHHMKRGTSVANAHTTGAIALLLEQSRFMPPGGARATLLQRARRDTWTALGPAAGWGAGKLDLVSNGMTTGVDERFSSRLAFSPVFPNPSATQSTFAFTIDAQSLSLGASTPVGVQVIDANGRVVARLAGTAEAGPQRLVWDGRGDDGTPVAPGIYFARLEIGNEFSVRKFVRMAE
jgi:subtilisin family serine protease